MANENYERLVAQLKEYATINQVAGLLSWDQETYMPDKAAEDRANQLAYLAGLAHEKLTRDELGRTLETLAAEASEDPVIATNVRETKRERDRAVKLPNQLVKDLAKATTLGQEAWTEARKDSDFSQFEPHLNKLLDLKREVADRIGWDVEPYDALLDDYEPGATAREIEELFGGLKKSLVPLVAAFRDAAKQPDLEILKRSCPPAQQAAFNRRVVESMGFDFAAGRIDVSTHPFCSGSTPNDVRLTTRYDEHYFPTSLFGCMHEAGHGLYEQGLLVEHAGTPMGSSVSLGIHESQSRLWENQVGRSRPFWECWYGTFQETFASLKDVALDDFHFAINNVRPSFIRVEADEVTYGLHIMLRFMIEREMISGKLATSAIPARWNELFTELFGITPPNDAQGCLQDIHWSFAAFGYFPTYQLGNLYAAQIFDAAQRALPDLEEQIRRGELRPLREWLRENVHQYGMRYRAKELIEHVTGAPPSPQPFIDYVERKFKPLYGV